MDLVFSEAVFLPIVLGNGCNDPEQWLTLAPNILIITENNHGYFLPSFQLIIWWQGFNTKYNMMIGSCL